VQFEYAPAREPEALPASNDLRVDLPEDLCARLAVAAELHSTTALKAAHLEIRQLGPEACALAEHIRQSMRSYDMIAIQRLLAENVVPYSPAKPQSGHGVAES
jgi:hypothetical protein